MWNSLSWGGETLALIYSPNTGKVRQELVRMGYTLDVQGRTSGPVNVINLDRLHGSRWRGSSDAEED